MDGITMDVHFKADSVTAKQALNDFMDDAKSIEKQYGESDTLSVMLDNASGGLSEPMKYLENMVIFMNRHRKRSWLQKNRHLKLMGKTRQL